MVARAASILTSPAPRGPALLDALSLGAAAGRSAVGAGEARGVAAGGAGAFSSILSSAAIKKSKTETPEQSARHAAEEFVSLSLVEPILASLRGSKAAAKPFAPGDAERSFRPLLDAEIARRIVKKSDFAIVNSVAQKLLQQFRGAEAARRAKEVDRHA